VLCCTSIFLFLHLFYLTGVLSFPFTVAIVPGNPVILLAVENVELAESTDIPIIDRKDVYDGDAKKNSVDLISKC
jgi:hypothetical protein